jgi:hypothetical protein
MPYFPFAISTSQIHCQVRRIDLSDQLVFLPVDAAISCTVMLDAGSCYNEKDQSLPPVACNLATTNDGSLQFLANVFSLTPPPTGCHGTVALSVL